MTGDQTVPWRRRGVWTVAAAVVAGVLLVAGVWWAVAGSTGSTGSPAPPGSGPDDGGGTVVAGSEAVHFEQGHGFAGVSTVLRSPADVRVFAGRYPQDGVGAELREKLLDRDLGAEALVAMAWSSGCTSAEGAVLTYAEGTGYSARLTGTTTYQNCESPWEVLAVFAVPEQDVGAEPLIGGTAPDPPGPAALLAYAPLDGRAAAAREPRAAEVSQPDQFETFLRPLPGEAARLLENELGSVYDAELPGSGRRFAFEGRGCGDDVRLEITAERLRPLPADDSCRDPEPYVAVFSVPADHVPASAVIGD